MNKLVKRSYAILFSLVLLMSMSIVSFAQGTTSIAVTKASIGVGDSTTVTVNASASGTVTVKYTASLMNLTKCSASGYSSEGNTITFKGTSADLVFSATEAGTASIIVSSSSCSGSSTTISIWGEAATSELASEETEASESASTEEAVAEETEVQSAGTGCGTLNDNGGFDIDGVSYVVSERFTDAEIPAGFSKVSLKIASGTYNELTNNTITIIYLKPADHTDGSGVFYIYDAEQGTVSPFSMLGTAGYYVLVSSPASSMSSALFEAPLTLESGSYTAYTLENSIFYYVYGTDSKGYEGWFMYDTEYGTIARADVNAFSTAAVSDEDFVEESAEKAYDSTEVFKDKIKKLRRIISVLVVLWVIVVFALINLFIKKRGEEDDDNDEIFGNHRPIKLFDRSDDEDDEDDEEDDEEENDDEKVASATVEKKKAESNKNSGIDMMDLNDL